MKNLSSVTKVTIGHSEVTLHAVIQRINRQLRWRNAQLRKYRGGWSWTTLGDYYIVDLYRNSIIAGNVDPKNLARELGVIRKWESIIELGE